VKPIPAPQAKVNIYLDDPFWTLFGDKTTRDLQLGFALMILLACGFRISWRKGARGTAVEWIGLLYSLDNSSNTASISIPKITAEDISVEAKALSELSMIPLSRLRKFTGKASWVMNIIPRTRWAVQRLWAAVSKQEAVAKSHRSGVRFSRRPCLVASKQVILPLVWIATLWSSSQTLLCRQFSLAYKAPKLEMIFDASPWGFGGVLAHVASGQAIEFLHDCITAGDLHRFDLELGSSKGQQVWETRCLLIGLKCWGKFVQNDNVSLRVRSDSVAALTVICKLGSSSPKLNAIAAEISLELSKLGIQEVLAVHLPGEQNTVADKLSRLAQPGCDGKLPESLRGAKRRLVQHRDASFFQMWAVATK
jgi:hypothetical protein